VLTQPDGIDRDHRYLLSRRKKLRQLAL
jgi:hypothetical protein